MKIRKEHTEFHKIDLDRGWENLPGYPDGIRQQVLAGDLDENKGAWLSHAPPEVRAGRVHDRALRHEYWEEVYVISGDLIVGSDRHGKGGTRFGPHTYACRPPGTLHGPFKSETGCLLLEMHYYDDAVKA